MDDHRKNAYRLLLAAGLLHQKWDLACWGGGFSVLSAGTQMDAARRASARAYALHNLALFAANDFEGFSEDRFWRDVDKFHEQWPSAVCPYRTIFERALRGESVNLVAPSGIGDSSEHPPSH